MSASCCLTCECGPHDLEEQAFEAMREALHIAEDGLVAAIEMYGANFSETLPKIRTALALADKVSK